MIVAESLRKRYGAVVALDQVSFTIQPGEAVALWGSNGAGKTTLIRCLLGLQSFEGNLTVNGIDARRNARAVRGLIGYVSQETAFYDMTVWETLHFYARLKKVKSDRIGDALERVNLTEHSRKRVGQLSGGMKQRLALGMALLADPPILVLDEPTANLDAQAQRDFVHAIQALNHAGKTILFSSHRLDEVMSLAGRVLVLNGGKLALECKPQQLIESLKIPRWLRLWIPNTHRESSISLLEQFGYTYSPNGRSIYVRVDTGSKIALLRTLEAANVPIEDFEVVDSELSQENIQ